MAPSDVPAPTRAARSLPWLEPLAAARRLRAAGHDVALLDGMGLHPEARFGYVTVGWRCEVRIEDGLVTVVEPSGAIEARPDDALECLRRLLEPDPQWAPHPEGAFTGGWVAALGFGFARLVEPTLPQADGGWPQALLRETTHVLVFDRARRTCILHAHDPDGDAVGLERTVLDVESALQEPLAPSSNPHSSPLPLPAAHPRAHAPAPTRTAPPPSAPTAPPPSAPLGWEPQTDQAAFEDMVRAARALVHDGDLFQVNLAASHTTHAPLDPFALLERLAATNPAPYMGVLPFQGTTIVSGSPEQLFATHAGRIRARPIAGTRGRGLDAAADAAKEDELANDPKERAEHLMLVDLVRNDLARVCEPGTVHVPELAAIERYRHVMHLVSRVEGQLRPGTHPLDCILATFPGGTVTGAPKVRAAQRILELERTPRGFYTGSVGVIDRSGDAHLNILIRSLVEREGTWHVHAGSGIVADSDPTREWRELLRKARGMLEAASGANPATPATRLGEVTQRARWEPPRHEGRPGAGRRVLLVDNYDSFVHNLADHVAALGAQVHTVRNDGDWRKALAAFAPTHVLLSPGPGWPRAAGAMPEIVAELLGRIPMLGVCLGHQALGEHAGAPAHRHPAGPVHGKADWVHHDGQGLFAGLPSPLEAMRYHSLVVPPPPAPWTVDAWLADGTVMAIRHPGGAWGLQFHPESIGTPLGLCLLANWLAAPSGAPAKPLSTPRGVERVVP